MDGPWYRVLTDSLVDLAARRKGQVFRRAGFLSTETEIGLTHGVWSVVYGLERPAAGLGRLTLFVRLAAPPESRRRPDPDGVPLMPATGPVEPIDALGPGSGFHLVLDHPGSRIERWLHRLTGPRVRRSAHLDDWFMLESAWLGHFDRALHPALRRPFRELCAGGGGGGDLATLSVVLTRFAFRVRRDPPLLEPGPVEDFLDRSLEFLETARSVNQQVPEITAASRLLEGSFREEAGWCGVCGEPVTDRRVICGQCLAPHHQECWTWIGRCAIYACGSRIMR